MRVPDSLIPLIEQGVIQEVIRPVMSGKEAEVFLVWSEGERCIAKVYKDVQSRSFKHRSQYTEGRQTRNTRDQRAMSRRSRHGRREEEQAWRATEVDVLERLQHTDVPVPRLYAFLEGVLVMELICNDDGEPAPRLADVNLHPDEAEEIFFILLRSVQRMLCVGVVHGDLSDFNILLTRHGPVIIDFPQAVDPAHNRNARRLLIRDVRNLSSFLACYVPNLRRTKYGEEMWDLYERGELRPDTKLTGKVRRKQGNVDLDALMEEIASANAEDRRKREALGLPPRRPARQPRIREEEPPPEPAEAKSGGQNKRRRRRRRKPSGEGGHHSGGAQADRSSGGSSSGSRSSGGSSSGSRSSSDSGQRRRRRRRRRKPSEKSGGGSSDRS